MQLRTGDDAVHETMAEQEFGALEPLRQLRRDGARRDPRPGEADERVGLGDVDVTDRRERGEDATGRRVGQDRDEGHATGPQPLERGKRLGQLHQRQRPLLHPGATRRADDDEGHASGQGVFGGPGDLLADDRAHRAAHEPEIHHADRDLVAADRAGAPDRRVTHPGRQLGGGQSVGVRLLVDEAERVDRLQARVALRPRALVEEVAEPRLGRQAEVMAAGRADPQVLLELLVEQHRRTGRALGPQVRRVDVAASAERRQLERHQTILARPNARTARAIGSDVG